MGDCGIDPVQDQWSYLFDDDTALARVKYVKVFELLSISHVSRVYEGSDGCYYLKHRGQKFASFSKALEAMDDFVLHTYFVIPQMLKPKYIEDVSEQMNALMNGLIFRGDDFKWKRQWEIYLNKKCTFNGRKGAYRFVDVKKGEKLFLLDRFGPKNVDLHQSLEALMRKMVPVLNVYRSLCLCEENEPEVLKQHGFHSALMFKYWNVLLGWSVYSKDIRYESLSVLETNFIERNEIELKAKYHREKGLEYLPDYDLYDGKKELKHRIWERLTPLFVASIEAYHEYRRMLKKGIDKDEAMYYSGIHNDTHYELASLLVKEYTSPDED